MGDVTFVRERTGGCDLVIAILPDGRPAWALDLDRDLQWWYPDGNTRAVRAAIAEQWQSLPTLPVLAVSPRIGQHPAVEMGRRAEASQAVPEAPGDDVISRLQRRWSRASRPARIAIVSVAIAAGVIATSTLLGGPGPAPAQLPVGSDGQTVTVPQVPGTPCQVRGELAHETSGQLLVCVPADRATPWTLAWRPTG